MFWSAVASALWDHKKGMDSQFIKGRGNLTIFVALEDKLVLFLNQKLQANGDA